MPQRFFRFSEFPEFSEFNETSAPFRENSIVTSFQMLGMSVLHSSLEAFWCRLALVSTLFSPYFVMLNNNFLTQSIARSVNVHNGSTEVLLFYFISIQNNIMGKN